VIEAAAHGWYENAQSWSGRFERAFAERHAVKHAMALPSCTSAIHLTLAALGIGPGDEVIVPDVTWIATAAPVTYCGATPVFADIDADTWCIDPKSVEANITDKTRAVIGVDLYGSVCDWTSLSRIAKPRGITLIEDAAEAIGSTYVGNPAGSFADVGCFSFHGSKTMTTGEGGMLITDRSDLFSRIETLRDHGRSPGDKQFWNSTVGFKYRMSQVQAALGVAQLERLDELVRRKRQIFAAYSKRLSGIPGVKLNIESPGVSSSYWMTTAVLHPSLGIPKEQLMADLSDRGIDTRPFFYPLSSLPAFYATPEAARARRTNHAANTVSPFGINLPSAAALGREEIEHVCDAFAAVVGKERSGVHSLPSETVLREEKVA
jgi:perosamine synthetase